MCCLKNGSPNEPAFQCANFLKIIIMVYERKHCGCGLKKEVNINELGVGRCSKALDEFFDS